MSTETRDLLQGTLGLLILKALSGQELHGYGVARWIESVTGDVLTIAEGSLYPALRRLEDKGLIVSRWALTEHNRQARLYALTSAGRQHLQKDASVWMQYAEAVMVVLRSAPAVV